MTFHLQLSIDMTHVMSHDTVFDVQNDDNAFPLKKTTQYFFDNNQLKCDMGLERRITKHGYTNFIGKNIKL